MNPVHDHSTVGQWRKGERARLIATRQLIPQAARERRAGRIGEHLLMLLGRLDGRVVSGYWPFRGEPDLRPWMERIAAQGGQCALPVVVERSKPMVFRPWRQGAALRPGIWNIPVPATEETVRPEIILAPVVGFDEACFRLGYGGGYFDRTLAILTPRPRLIGVGFAHAAIPTIHPLPHDIAMDVIATESGIVQPSRPKAPTGGTLC